METFTRATAARRAVSAPRGSMSTQEIKLHIEEMFRDVGESVSSPTQVDRPVR